MKVTLYGVRGSMPTPGPATVKYGGNTTSIVIEFNQDLHLIVDAGTGIIGLGRKMKKPSNITILFTHFHWDHIQGLPFFDPLYNPKMKIDILSGQPDMASQLIKAQMNGITFPVSWNQVPSQVTFYEEPLENYLAEKGVVITKLQTNHPGVCFAYKVSYEGKTMVFCPDNEISQEQPITTLDEFIHFFQGTDLLIHDAQYTQDDFPLKKGWGHSHFLDTVSTAIKANVTQLILFHHDPLRSDKELDELEKKAQGVVTQKGSSLKCEMAYEKMTINL